MKRREFITLLGGAAAAWPLGARAQQGERIRQIGVLFASLDKAYVAAFAQGLSQLGWSEGRSVRIETRQAGGEVSRVRAYAGELVVHRRGVEHQLNRPAHRIGGNRNWRCRVARLEYLKFMTCVARPWRACSGISRTVNY
jgi:hypothetical protein